MAKVDHRPNLPQTQPTTESKPSFPSGASDRAQLIDTLRASADPKNGIPLGKSVSRLAHLRHELKKEGVSAGDAKTVLQKAAQYEVTAEKSGKAPTDGDWQKEIQSLLAGLKAPTTSSK